MVHELLKEGEVLKERFGETIYLTDKRLIKTNRMTYFEDLNLDAIESVELKISHYEMLLRIGSSLLILYTLFLVLDSVPFIASLGIHFKTVSIACLIAAVASLVAYFVMRNHITKVYGHNKIMVLHGHDWDIAARIRHHSFDKQEGKESPIKKIVKKEAKK